MSAALAYSSVLAKSLLSLLLYGLVLPNQRSCALMCHPKKRMTKLYLRFKRHFCGICIRCTRAAEMQAQLGDKAVTGVVSMAVSNEGSETHFEAFQV